MRPQIKIQRLIDRELKNRGEDLDSIHQQTDIDYSVNFWLAVCDLWMNYCYETIENEPKYQWEKEWELFWLTIEKLYPQYILKPLCAESQS